ncbi:hypothetical protein [Microbacterium jejuense]|uniref:hypothetical protein n=1 Tax=Microbacterium jejuense TaxID=1263637 RepID=UPI0031ED7AB6
MRALGVVFLILFGIALAVAGFVFATWVVVWNLTDMQNVGINFWNVFWILLVGTVLFGGVGASRR